MTAIPGQINMKEYAYELPHDRIAEYPVEQRDHSRLLVYGSDTLLDDRFYNLDQYLPSGSLMVSNDTRVIRARLIFSKETGARIEVFCLEPVKPTAEISRAFEATSGVLWKCLIGNAKKWRSGKLLMTLPGGHKLYAERKGEMDGVFLVSLSWDPPEMSLAEVIDEAGKIPLPPYIEREAEDDDTQRYQTIYAQHDGSVAAPTAGLHFTEEVMRSLESKRISMGHVTLHVGAGTFKPVAHDDIRDHEMHTEQIIITKALLHSILENERPLVAVGTTSMRTLESLYWYGNMLAEDMNAVFSIKQWTPYRDGNKLNAREAIENIIEYMRRHGLEELTGDTSLIIVPGYYFRIVDILLTNFHMPRSTLLLLVAAFTGKGWKDAYDYALRNDFRFLSYGDSCLFYKQDQNL
ncbi:MAG: S-adenosylmethionine:tRNA ribosyltransferase-isomerase [Bacteroidota bacterium]